MLAIYVFGSVHRGEALAPRSDVDLLTVISDDITVDDEGWLTEANARVAVDFPREDGATWMCRAHPYRRIFALTPDPGGMSAERIRMNAWLVRMQYDATLLWGRRLHDEWPRPITDAAWARAAWQSPWKVVRFAASGELPAGDADARTAIKEWPLPGQPMARLRALARLAVLGGAYLLIAQGAEPTFKGSQDCRRSPRATRIGQTFFAKPPGIISHRFSPTRNRWAAI